MRVILFGATGMVGQGVLRECLLDGDVETMLAVVRRPGSLGQTSSRVRELVAEDFYEYSHVEREFAGYDACLFCLGASAVGMKEAEYRRLAHDLTIAAAAAVLRANPARMTFEYVSGAGTNASGRQMWARVKGETENALLAMGFRAAYMFRPGLIVPLHGIRSKTAFYQATYTVLRPVLPLMLRMFPNQVTTTEVVGRAMLRVAKSGYPKHVLESADIAQVGRP
jgi:uncharacterized protein YbjT (DUF2867 family)